MPPDSSSPGRWLATCAGTLGDEIYTPPPPASPSLPVDGLHHSSPIPTAWVHGVRGDLECARSSMARGAGMREGG
jgi:hypothetical protein